MGVDHNLRPRDEIVFGTQTGTPTMDVVPSNPKAFSNSVHQPIKSTLKPRSFGSTGSFRLKLDSSGRGLRANPYPLIVSVRRRACAELLGLLGSLGPALARARGPCRHDLVGELDISSSFSSTWCSTTLEARSSSHSNALVPRVGRGQLGQHELDHVMSSYA